MRVWCCLRPSFSSRRPNVPARGYCLTQPVVVYIHPFCRFNFAPLTFGSHADVVPLLQLQGVFTIGCSVLCPWSLAVSQCPKMYRFGGPGSRCPQPPARKVRVQGPPSLESFFVWPPAPAQRPVRMPTRTISDVATVLCLALCQPLPAVSWETARPNAVDSSVVCTQLFSRIDTYSSSAATRREGGSQAVARIAFAPPRHQAKFQGAAAWRRLSRACTTNAREQRAATCGRSAAVASPASLATPHYKGHPQADSLGFDFVVAKRAPLLSWGP